MTTKAMCLRDFVSLNFQPTAMKDINDNIESPFTLKVSFNKFLNHYEELAKSDDEFIAGKAKRILKAQEPIPVLRDGPRLTWAT